MSDWIGATILLIGGVWNAFSQSEALLIGRRVMIGSAGAIAKVAALALLMEMAHPRLRPALGEIYYVLFYSGSLISGLMCSEYRAHCPGIVSRDLTTVAGLYIEGYWSWRRPCWMQFVDPVAVLALTARSPGLPRACLLTAMALIPVLGQEGERPGSATSAGKVSCQRGRKR